MKAHEWLALAVQHKASDIFVGAGRYISFKINGVVATAGETPITMAEAKEFIDELYALAERSNEQFKNSGDDDFSVTISKLARFRVNTYNQRSTPAAVIRVVLFELPNPQNLEIPDEVMRIAGVKNGLVLVTGVTGSGKSTTLACIIDAINKSRTGHIITLEDPIEYLHRDKMCLISQREIPTDTKSYITALRACLRQSPDIVLLGEMRDEETIKTAMTAAETGHLVISTLHTMGAAKTIDRIIDAFPPEQQPQMRTQLAMILRTVVSQQLVKRKDGTLIPAFEIMHVNKDIQKLIIESKTFQIDTQIDIGKSMGMIGMDAYLTSLVERSEIAMETAVTNATKPDEMKTIFESRFFDEFRDESVVRVSKKADWF
ncbi:MAG: PilT/PilU family type 4a pilus ATPase [Defluviitaleaceae bacterium]|nr:PilT/PilU family type 4a pilus ATPase [Defluviitaleaceae bacterium]